MCAFTLCQAPTCEGCVQHYMYPSIACMSSRMLVLTFYGQPLSLVAASRVVVWCVVCVPGKLAGRCLRSRREVC